MKYLTIQGSSKYKITVRCNMCKKKYIWLRAFETREGHYVATCGKCIKKFRDKYDKKKDTCRLIKIKE